MKLYIGPYDRVTIEPNDVFAEWHYIPYGYDAEYIEDIIEKKDYKYMEAQRYVADLCDRMILAASTALNKMHDVSFDCSEWRIYYGTWLYNILFSLYDSYEKIMTYTDEDCVAVSPYLINSFERCGMVNSIGKIVNDDLFHSNVYRQICIKLGIPVEFCASKKKSRIREKTYNFIRFSTIRNQYVKKLITLRKSSEVIEDVRLPSLKDKDMVLLRMRFSDTERFKITDDHRVCVIDENDIEKIQNRLTDECVFVYSEKTKIFDDFAPENVFEEIATDIISYNLPIEVVECFGVLNAFAEDYCKSIRIKKIYSSAFVGQSCLASLISIYLQRNGATLYDVQHSAVYNINLGNRFCEQYVFDQFLTWGVKNENADCKVRPVGITRLNYDNGIGVETQISPQILLCSNPIEKYECGRNMLFAEYANNHSRFLNALSQKKRSRIVARLFADDYKSPIYQLYLHEFHHVRMQNVRDKGFYDAIREVELVVVDSYSSTHIEAMALKKPVIFFEGTAMPVRDKDVERLLVELHEQKIYAYSPEEAARFVNEIIDVRDWWMSDSVQKVVQRYLNVCAHNYDGIANTWKEEILK